MTSGKKPIAEPVAERLGRALWARNPAMFADALAGSGTLAHATDLGMRSLRLEELVGGLARVPNTTIAVVQRRRDLLTAPSFWRLPGLDAGGILEAAAVESDASAPIVGAMIVGGRSDVADAVVQRFGAASLIEAIEAVATEVPADNLLPWLNALGRRAADLAEALVRGAVRQRVLLAGTRASGRPRHRVELPWRRPVGIRRRAVQRFPER